MAFSADYTLSWFCNSNSIGIIILNDSATGRFYHLISIDCGKDYGVRKTIEFYKNNKKIIGATGAVGDSFNDIPMLKEVDYPYIVKKIDGTWINTKLKVIRIKGTGPLGFTEAVKDFLIRVSG